MSELPVFFAFTAGLAALVSPCGAVMLPAYVSYYLGLDENPQFDSRFRRNIINPLKIGLIASIGIVILFASFGIFWSFIGQIVKNILPGVGLILGIGLAFMGGYVLTTGKYLQIPILTLQNYKLERTYSSIFLFGLAYGIATISCTFPIFLAIMGHALTLWGGTAAVIQFTFYGLGLSFGLVLITLLAATFKSMGVGLIRTVVPYMERIYALTLMFSGIYISWYWWDNWFMFN